MASPIRIRVGAATDSSLTSVFRPFVEAAKAARKQAEAELGGFAVQIRTRVKKGVDDAASETAKIPRATKKATDEAERAFAKLAKDTEKWSREGAREHDRAEREKTRTTERETKERERLALRAASQAERAMRRETAGLARNQERGRAASMKAFDVGIGASARVARFGLNAGQRVAGDLLRGSGVNTDFGSMVSQSVSLEKQTVDLVNAGYMPSQQGANGQRQNAGALANQLRQVGTDTGFDPTKLAEGLQSFVGKTGDLQAGRDLLADMGKLARATGAEIEDMADAAGDVSNGLGDVPNKAAKVAEVMRSAAAMGKEGAVEIKDLATQMAKLQAAASQFSGSGEKNMGDMVALAQVTRAKGGASSATQAATSVGSFLNTFSKGARLDAFEAKGIKVRNEEGKLRSARDIITDSLEATGGDSRQMGKLFADSGARRVTRGFETIYADAGGGSAGIEAVRKAFDDLANATMSQREITESFAASMNTTEAKVQVFNNTMSKIADDTRVNLMPALESLAPVIISTSKAFADWAGKLTGKTDQDADEHARQVDLAASRETTKLRNGVNHLELKDTDIASAQKALADEDTEIAAKKARLAKSDADWEATPFAFKAIMGGSHDEKRKQDVDAIKNMEKERDSLKKELRDILTGELRVRVINTNEMQPKTPSPLPPNNPGAKGKPGAHIETVHGE